MLVNECPPGTQCILGYIVRVRDKKKMNKQTLAIYNKHDVHKTIVLFTACIVFYSDSFIRAFIGIYHAHLWFSFRCNRRGFGSEERGNARWFQRRQCARRYVLQVNLGIPDRRGSESTRTYFLITSGLIRYY